MRGSTMAFVSQPAIPVSRSVLDTNDAASGRAVPGQTPENPTARMSPTVGKEGDGNSASRARAGDENLAPLSPDATGSAVLGGWYQG